MFFVHVAALLSKSSNGFGGLLRLERLRSAPANKYQLFATQNTAEVLNLVLCVFYDISVLPQAVHLQDLVAAVDSLAVYGLPLQERARPGTPLFQLLATHVATTPIEIYALAASHDLQELAVLASGYSLRTRARDISDDQTTRMGALYLHKLLSLQLGRKQKLKELLLQPPAGHPTTAICNAAGQERLVNAWKLMGAYFMWETSSGACLSVSFSPSPHIDVQGELELTTVSLEVNFGSLVQNISCITCKLACQKRLAEVLCGWEKVKVRCSAAKEPPFDLTSHVFQRTI